MTDQPNANTPLPPLPSRALNVNPDAETARIVGRSYRQLLINDLIRAVDHAATGLEIEVPLLRERIVSLDTAKRFSPALFSGFTRLADAFRSESPEEILDGLQWLCSLTLSEILDARFRVGSILEERWEEAFVREVRKPPTGQHREGEVVLHPLLETDLSEVSSIFDDALSLIEEADEGLYGEFSAYVSRVKLFTGQGIAALSSPRVFGALYVRLPSDPVALGPYFIEHLAHETSHLALNALMAHAALLENPEDIHEAPIRPDPRPLYQVLHGTFVLARHIRLFERLAEAVPEAFARDDAFEVSRAAYARGRETLAGAARWTAAGAELFNSFEEWAD